MNLFEFSRLCIDRLNRAGTYNTEADATNILKAVLGTNLPAGKTLLSADTIEQLETILRRRERRDPLARILGYVEFCGLQIKTHDGVFRPYPETEALIEPVLEYFSDKSQPLRALDIGTGSGCLLLAALKEYPKASGLGIDIDPRAVAAAQENSVRLGLDARAEFKLSDWGRDLAENFDLVISNPPRVPSPMVPRLLPEMRDHDPRPAYDGGVDGLDYFRGLAERFETLCKPTGCGVFQVSEADKVARIFQRRTRTKVKINKNYMGLESSISVTFAQ